MLCRFMCRTGLPHAAVLQDAPFFSHQAGEGEKKNVLMSIFTDGLVLLDHCANIRGKKKVHQPTWVKSHAASETTNGTLAIRMSKPSNKSNTA